MKEQLFIRQSLRGILLFAVLALFGCGAGITVQVDYDKQTNFGALRSFSFKEVKTPSRADQLVQQAIQTELLAKRYNETGTESADFRVVYHAALQKKTIWQREYSPSGAPTGVVPITFNEGTIAIQIIDPKTGKVIWTGQAEQAIDNQTQALSDVQPEVSKILARFPPR